MNPKTKKQAYRHLRNLEVWFFSKQEEGEMKSDEYDWIREKIMDIASSINNLDDENMEQCVKRMKSLGLTMEDEI